MRRLRWIIGSSVLLLVSCMKTCIGTGELGSKERPLVIALEGWSDPNASVAHFSKIQRCLDKTAGYRTAFEIYADGSSVVRSLIEGDAYLGLMESASFVSEGMNAGIVPLFLAGRQQRYEKRSVIIGKDASGHSDLERMAWQQGRSGWPQTLKQAAGGIIAYHSQSSTEGFLVPRQMLLEADILPRGAIFTTDWYATEELVRSGNADVGVLSDEYLVQKWHEKQIVPGLVHDGLVVLAVSPPIPKKLVVAQEGSSLKVVMAIKAGLELCSQGEAAEAIERTFGGQQFEAANLADFEFLRDVVEFQRVFVRVLPANSAH